MAQSEKELISMIREMSGSGSGQVLVTIGDDCAVIRRDDRMLELITTDTLVENVTGVLAELDIEGKIRDKEEGYKPDRWYYKKTDDDDPQVVCGLDAVSRQS